MITGIVYISQATRPFTEEQLIELAAKAAEKNQLLDITGCLFYSNTQFIQYIEGERTITERLMDTIRKDDRHTVIVELANRETPERRFTAWNMRWLKQQDMQHLNLEHAVADYMLDKATHRNPIDWENGVWKMISALAWAYANMAVKSGQICQSNEK